MGTGTVPGWAACLFRALAFVCMHVSLKALKTIRVYQDEVRFVLRLSLLFAVPSGGSIELAAKWCEGEVAMILISFSGGGS